MPLKSLLHHLQHHMIQVIHYPIRMSMIVLDVPALNLDVQLLIVLQHVVMLLEILIILLCALLLQINEVFPLYPVFGLSFDKDGSCND
jgi:hypothetical protein